MQQKRTGEAANVHRKKAGPITEFIDRHYRHFNAAVVKDAADAYIAHLNSGGKMMVTLAGAMSTASMPSAARGRNCKRFRAGPKLARAARKCRDVRVTVPRLRRSSHRSFVGHRLKRRLPYKEC